MTYRHQKDIASYVSKFINYLSDQAVSCRYVCVETFLRQIIKTFGKLDACKWKKLVVIIASFELNRQIEQSGGNYFSIAGNSLRAPCIFHKAAQN